MNSKLRLFNTFEIAAIVLICILVAWIALLDWMWGAVALALTIVIGVYVKKGLLKAQHVRYEEFQRISKGIQQTTAFALQNLPIGMVIIDEQGHICWTNSVFRDWLPVLDVEKTGRLSGFIPAMRIDKLWGKSGYFQDTIDGRHYRIVYKSLETHKKRFDDVPEDALPSFMAFYFEDITETEASRQEILDLLPACGLIVMDNIEDLSAGLSDVEYTNLWAEINRLIVSEIDGYNGFIRSTAEDTYIFTCGREALLDMMEKKFPIIGKVHNLQTSKHIPPTLSIGVVFTSETMKVQSEKAKAALEIALGRGGDQACVYFGDEVKFFGGTTKGLEKNTRVRARVVSQAIHEIMSESDNIIVMGHEREDYDSIGSSIGVAMMAKALNKPVHIAVSSHLTGVDRLLEAVSKKVDWEGLIISADEAVAKVTSNTTVIVTDVHRADMVAAPEALAKAERRIVIDHHRRSSDFIDKLLLTYLEPASSSTSELVSELIQYFESHVALTSLEASALYAGIVVDTKNFVVQTGARTFEAASFLRRSGADTTFVRHLFSKSFDAMQIRGMILAGAEQVDHMAFAVAPDHVADATVIAAQAADMLIGIEGIEASFVLYNLPDGGIGISARSQGDMNVQLVMEALGGGGHRTVAGAQVREGTISEVKANVMEVARRAMAELIQERMES